MSRNTFKTFLGKAFQGAIFSFDKEIWVDTKMTENNSRAKQCLALLNSKNKSSTIQKQQNAFHILLDQEGYIRAYKVLTSTLHGISNTKVAEGAFFLDFTNYLNLLYLMHLYVGFYKDTKKALATFSNYLTLDKYFQKALYKRELIVLLEMHENKAAYALSEMTMRNRNMREIIEAIQKKLKNKVTLQTVFEHFQEIQFTQIDDDNFFKNIINYA